MRSTLAALAAAVLLAGPTTSAAPAASPARPRVAAPGAAARAKRPVRATHPVVGADPAVDCAGCHAGATPESYAAWRESKHGLALVKCLVCHGSTGRDFTRRPQPDRCLGCHGEQVASLEAGGLLKGKDCFSCHAAHALSPHAVRKDQTTAARLGADVALERERQAGPVNGPAAPPPASAPPAASAAAPGASPQPSGGPAVPPIAGKEAQSAQQHPPFDKPQGSTP